MEKLTREIRKLRKALEESMLRAEIEGAKAEKKVNIPLDRAEVTYTDPQKMAMDEIRQKMGFPAVLEEDDNLFLG